VTPRGAVMVALTAALLSLAAPGGVNAATGDTVLPARDNAHAESHELVLNGVGVRHLLFLDFYQAALYLPRRLTNPDVVLNTDMPRRVRITLLRDVSAERDVEFLLAGLKDNNSAEEMAAIQAPLDQFLRLLRALGSVPKGSVVLLDYRPGTGTRVLLDNQLLGTVPGVAFNRSVLKIWLGARPIQNSLKRALLGGMQAI
jgi:hypothetical protein